MTEKSPQPSDDEPVHVFDQTNGVLQEEPEAPRRGRRTAAEGDLPVATHVVLGGF